ncbi:MAG: ArsR/SmtB family transcription factor [Actinomycetota bacterium]
MTQPAILKHMATMADVTRCRVLRLLARQELTVSELCSVLQLPQSTVSRHLKALLDDHWIASRRDGTSRLYSMNPTELAPDAGSLWGLIQSQLAASPAALQDHLRLEGVLTARRSKSREFFSSAAGEWDRLREELFGRTFHLCALMGLLDESWTVGDLGCGTGVVTATVAPWVREVIAVDDSAEMLRTARGRLEGVTNVDLRQGELEALPLQESTLDAALLFMVLHYIPDIPRVLSEVARVLKPGGKLLMVDMLPHDREEYQQQMGHVWLGFSEQQVQRYLAGAELENGVVRPLATDPEAMGPALFAATARRGR